IAGRQCRSSGMTGSGGTVPSLTTVPSSSGASAAKSRQKRSTSVASSAAQKTGPAKTVRPRGCRANRAEVIERRRGPKGRTLEYRLTSAGRDLQPVVQAIGEWGATWSVTEPRAEELDPYLLIVWMARHVDRQRLPPDRTVVQFDFRDPKRRYWMVLEPSEVSVCLQHPGFDVDLQIIVDTTTLYRVYLGRAELGGAIRAGQLTMSGPRTLQRGFGHWFTWSAFASASRSAQERRTAASRLASPHRVRIAEGQQASSLGSNPDERPLYD